MEPKIILFFLIVECLCGSLFFVCLLTFALAAKTHLSQLPNAEDQTTFLGIKIEKKIKGDVFFLNCSELLPYYFSLFYCFFFLYVCLQFQLPSDHLM